jgi:acetyl-CoA C-acetyltransferase
MEIDSIILGNHMAQTVNMTSMFSQMCKWLGMQFRAGVQISGACSTTNVGATLAATQIASGAYNNVLVVGVEVTSDVLKGYSPYEREAIPSDKMWMWTDQGVGQAYAVPQGYDIFPIYNGILGLGYCRKYGLSVEEFDRSMLELCRTRRLHGSMTPKATVQETLEDEAKRLGFNDLYEFWTSNYNPYLAWPTRLRSVVTACDGASAMILSNKETAAAYKGTPVELLGWGISVEDLPWYGADPTDWPLDESSFKKAYAMSGIKAEDIDYLHTHDCSHISGIVVAETSGYLPKGKGLEYASEGRLRFDGDRPMSTHGGRHAFGHAWTASAGSDTKEAVDQMRKRAGKKQMPKAPEIAVIHTHGYAMLSTVMVLKGGM